MAAEPLRIVFLDRSTLPKSARLRAPKAGHLLECHASTAPGEVLERIRDANVVITNKVPLRRAVLEQCPRLRFVAIAATGYDVVDIEACRTLGIRVANVRGYAVDTVPEHVFTLIFALRRSLQAFTRSVAAGGWQRAGQFCYFEGPIRDLAGARIGIIGDGTLGRAVARGAEAFGMRPVFAAHRKDRTGPDYAPFDEVIETSDILTLHCPLRPETRDLIGAEELRRMKPSALLINTARGGLVNEEELVASLRQGVIAGAGFDVVTQEPMPDDHPFATALDLPNFILTPHVAWASEEAVQRLADQLIDNIDAFVGGAPENLVA